MKRRIANAGWTGLGGGGPALMDGIPSVNQKLNALVRKCSKDAYETFFKGTKMDDGYVDAQIRPGELRVGIEPSYMYERLKIIVIEERLDRSYIQTGYSFGGWGSGLRSSKKYRTEYKRKSKFVRFVDKWHKVLFIEKKYAK